jgi:hypothetical protein
VAAAVQDQLRMNSHHIRTVVLVVVLWAQQLDLLAVVEVEHKVQEALVAHLDGELRTTELLARHLRVATATTKAEAAAVAGSVAAVGQTPALVRYGVATAVAVDQVMSAELLLVLQRPELEQHRATSLVRPHLHSRLPCVPKGLVLVG